jgi:uncharacterized protein
MKKIGLTILLFRIVVIYAQLPINDGFNQAYQYLKGIGKPLNPEKALSIFKSYAEKGDKQSINALGNMYLNGKVVEKNIGVAINYYNQAAKLGYSNSYYNLGQIYQQGNFVIQDFKTAYYYYEKGANANHLGCVSWLAYMNYKGLGITQNYTKAFELYNQLANKGNANAMYFLGLCYRSGYGTVANASLAKLWLQKAIDNNEQQAIHELYNETKPENVSVINKELQTKLASLKSYSENIITANTNNIAGSYMGYIVYYDFSAKYVQEIMPLKLTLEKTANGYKGNWQEGDTLNAEIEASFHNNQFVFSERSQYIRHNRYSYYKPEPYLFNKASLGVKYINDEMHLTGDMQFYSISRKEPGQPIFIALSRKMDNVELASENNFNLILAPNPTLNNLNVSFTLLKMSKVLLDILTQDGKKMLTPVIKTLPKGTYTVPIVVSQLPAGSYLIRIVTADNTVNKLFIKL